MVARGGICTHDLQVMSLVSYYYSTPLYARTFLALELYVLWWTKTT